MHHFAKAPTETDDNKKYRFCRWLNPVTKDPSETSIGSLTQYELRIFIE
jgi:hypothetical protein